MCTSPRLMGPITCSPPARCQGWDKKRAGKRELIQTSEMVAFWKETILLKGGRRTWLMATGWNCWGKKKQRKKNTRSKAVWSFPLAQAKIKFCFISWFSKLHTRSYKIPGVGTYYSLTTGVTLFANRKICTPPGSYSCYGWFLSRWTKTSTLFYIDCCHLL